MTFIAEAIDLTESAITLQLILEIQRFSLDDDTGALGNIGIDLGVAATIARMDAKAMRILCKGSFFNISIDESKLDNLIAYAHREKQKSDLVDRLIVKDAPRKMMMQSFGITGSEYVGLRKVQGLSKAPIGRWRTPMINTALPQHKKLLTEIDGHHTEENDLMQLPEICLQLADRYELTIREILTVWFRFPDRLEWETS